MANIDWIVLVSTIALIVGYGTWVTRKRKSLDSFLVGSREANWWTIGLSVMATQASAITFLSTPGQAFHDGMGFVQFYFGLPIAMVIICIFFIPIYNKLKVYTAYEFLESRFDYKTRALTSILFLVQRGLAAGITIFAPAIVLSRVLGWNLDVLIIIIGLLVILYTMIGGTKAVNVTQKYQMGIIFLGMFVAFYLILDKMPDGIGLADSLRIASAGDKMNVLDFSFDLSNKYTFWTGILGGTFLMLSYFGTDQSQVQRYLSGKNVRESQMGLIFNGFLKIPMQFFILLTGVMVFVFYQFNPSPAHFNQITLEELNKTEYKDELKTQENELTEIYEIKKSLIAQADISNPSAEFKSSYLDYTNQEREIRDSVKSLISLGVPGASTNDKDYVFINFIVQNFPKGLIGLLLAVFLCAAMSSTASELNALATTSLVDIYKRGINQDKSESHYFNMSRVLTAVWGGIAITFALYGSLVENLIQFVNIIGSIFYGTILGIFLVAFFIKRVTADSIFVAALISEILVICFWYFEWFGIAFLWLNALGALFVIILSLIIEALGIGSVIVKYGKDLIKFIIRVLSFGKFMAS